MGSKIVVSGRVKLVYQRRLPLWLADTIGRGPIEVVLSQPKCGAHSLANREDADAKFEMHDVQIGYEQKGRAGPTLGVGHDYRGLQFQTDRYVLETRKRTRLTS